MGALLSILTTRDWIFLGALSLVPILMVAGIHSIRKEMRVTVRAAAGAVSLKTTEEQRQWWRKTRPSGDLLDLLDDIDTLLGPNHARMATDRKEHGEALLLSSMGRHVPVGTLLLGSVLLAGIFSAIIVVIEMGPSNPIP